MSTSKDNDGRSGLAALDWVFVVCAVLCAVLLVVFMVKGMGQPHTPNPDDTPHTEEA